MKLDESPFVFSIRNERAFKELGITTLEELLATPEYVLHRPYNHGRKSVRHIIDELAYHGITYPPKQKPPPVSPDLDFIHGDFT